MTTNDDDQWSDNETINSNASKSKSTDELIPHSTHSLHSKHSTHRMPAMNQSHHSGQLKQRPYNRSKHDQYMPLPASPTSPTSSSSHSLLRNSKKAQKLSFEVKLTFKLFPLNRLYESRMTLGMYRLYDKMYSLCSGKSLFCRLANYAGACRACGLMEEEEALLSRLYHYFCYMPRGIEQKNSLLNHSQSVTTDDGHAALTSHGNVDSSSDSIAHQKSINSSNSNTRNS